MLYFDPMPDAPSDTRELLLKWHRGDHDALATLLERDRAWIYHVVRNRLGPKLRAKLESQDVVQDVVVEFLKYGPRFVLQEHKQFRALLARIVENVLCDKNDWFSAQRRDIHRERPLPDDSLLRLDAVQKEVQRPSEVADAHEWEAVVRLGLEFLEPEDREVILRRHWEGRSFAELARTLGISEDAARMRFRRALVKLTEKVHSVQRGNLGDLLHPYEHLADVES